MKRRHLLIWAMVVSINICSADTPNLEQELYEENQESQLEDNYIQSTILAQKAVRIGKETLQSLKSNLVFIQKLENDPEFVKCVVSKANLTKLDNLAKGAKKLFDKGKISKQDYNQYISELNSQKASIKQRVNSMCK